MYVCVYSCMYIWVCKYVHHDKNDKMTKFFKEKPESNGMGYDIVSYDIISHDTYRRLDERVPVDGPWQQGAVTSLMDHVSKVYLHIISFALSLLSFLFWYSSLSPFLPLFVIFFFPFLSFSLFYFLLTQIFALKFLFFFEFFKLSFVAIFFFFLFPLLLQHQFV